jgi:hypothetical protein
VGIHWGTFTTDRGARQTMAEFEKGRVEGFELCDVGVWAGGSKAAKSSDKEVYV